MWRFEKLMEAHGPVSSGELWALYLAGEIFDYTIVWRASVRPIEYFSFSQIKGEIEPKELEKRESEAPKPLEIYRPLHSELEYGRKPEFVATVEQRKEDIRRFLARKMGGF